MMARAAYRIGKYSFYTREEFEASLRDAMRFKELERIGGSEEEVAYNYMRQLKDRDIHFESQLGADFYLRNESLCDAWERKRGLGVYYRNRELQRRRRELRLHFFSGFFLGILLISCVFFFLFLRGDSKSADSLKLLQSVSAHDDEENSKEDAVKGVSANEADESTESVKRETFEEYETTDDTAAAGAGQKDVSNERVLANRKLALENPEFTGWLYIADTEINYPVMQRIGDDEYYLSHDFYGNEDHNGLLVLDDDCRPEDMGLLIHGHHMRSGAMFAGLEKYRDPLYCAMHPSFTFSTTDEEHEYTVFAVFEDHVNADSAGSFHFYRNINVNDIEEYEICVAGIKEHALYEIACTPKYGSRIIMLSTCDYTQENGRLIVAGVEKPDKPETMDY